jgi:DNA-binding NarL/FixJ family response regulator
MTLKNATLLAIDDDLLTLISLEDFLQPRCKQLLLETTSEIGFDLAVNFQPDIILLDILMGDSDGYDVCCRLKSNPKTQAIPVIFISTLSRTTDKVKGFEVGGVDYITKPFAPEEVLARLKNCLRLHIQMQINQQQKISLKQRNDIIAFYQLSEREIEIWSLYVSGKQRHEMAQQLFISENTVKTHLKNLFAKLGIKNRAEAVEKAQVLQLLNLQ